MKKSTDAESWAPSCPHQGMGMGAEGPAFRYPSASRMHPVLLIPKVPILWKLLIRHLLLSPRSIHTAAPQQPPVSPHLALPGWEASRSLHPKALQGRTPQIRALISPTPHSSTGPTAPQQHGSPSPSHNGHSASPQPHIPGGAEHRTPKGSPHTRGAPPGALCAEIHLPHLFTPSVLPGSVTAGQWDGG